MDNIEIDPAKEIERLTAMYIHYKILYRELILLCCSIGQNNHLFMHFI